MVEYLSCISKVPGSIPKSTWKSCQLSQRITFVILNTVWLWCLLHVFAHRVCEVKVPIAFILWLNHKLLSGTIYLIKLWQWLLWFIIVLFSSKTSYLCQMGKLSKDSWLNKSEIHGEKNLLKHVSYPDLLNWIPFQKVCGINL